ncbi:MAG TPA: copper resistance system multicopper oxidase, partial [Sphingopyxis sp.]|nr:copper resistance system multicopper oxidase [Sphingopyxis sp.]
MHHQLTRRGFFAGAAALGGGLAVPSWARSGHDGHLAGPGILSGADIRLSVGHRPFRLGKRTGHAITVNDSLPGPLLRLREGQNLRIAVTNRLKEDTSIHWHGLLLPFHMDGVPGVSFPGIRPGETFTYEFPVRQAGTYWYHSHSNMQEAMGLYGAIVIDPAGAEPAPYDREHILVLADWSFLHPHAILKKLKQRGGYFNRQKQTLGGLVAGRDQPAGDRAMWGRMRMDPTDISDVTGATYSYLVNGHDTAGNWTGLFAPGERVRLRIVNASAMTNFNIRIPGLSMTVVQADGLAVQPVETDEFQIAVAETYDVIVQPREAKPYGFIAEALDRSGQVRATLAPRMGMVAPVPPLRDRPLLGMKDMGMTDHAAMGHDMAGMDHGAMKMRDKSAAPGITYGPGVATVSPSPMDRTGDRPTGLEDAPHRVLTYRDLRSLDPNPDRRAPSRQIDVHLTANMERYMWSFDGVKLSENPEPIAFRHNERVRVNLINDTMMPHPIHLHGHFFEVVTGNPGHHPMKHTVNVLPGSRLSFDLTADAPGDWAFHCHMLM